MIPRRDTRADRDLLLVVLELSDDGIAGVDHFLDTESLLPLLGLPLRLDA